MDIDSPKDVIFVYDGLKFRRQRNSFECKNCVMERMIFGYDFLKKEGILSKGAIRVRIDWEKFCRCLADMEESRESGDMIQTLLNIGILVPRPNGNYAIVASGVFFFLLGSVRVFFKRFRDAKTVAEKYCPSDQYPWSVIKIKILAQSEIGAI
ncbi:MAG: hypothetical protein PHP35_00405 [Candidatus Colwellbacteria bacterium]|nr:hypothetical protein [Candidatus Colwellbacteria bacterium]